MCENVVDDVFPSFVHWSISFSWYDKFLCEIHVLTEGKGRAGHS